MINKQLFFYALGNLKRFHAKNLFITLVLSTLIALLGSVFLTAKAMQHEYLDALRQTPDIVVQNTKAGRYTTIDDAKLSEILEINGVADAFGRVDGVYRYAQGGIDFEIVGVDVFQKQYIPWLDELLTQSTLESGQMLVSKPLLEVLKQHYYTQKFRFITPSLELYEVAVQDSFTPPQTQQFVVVTTQEDAQKIFGYKQNELSEIAVYLSNQDELLPVVAKLQTLFYNANIITKEDRKIAIMEHFNTSKGVFVSLMVVALFTFFMIISDRLSGLSSAERREVGVIKALGWRVETVLWSRFIESALLFTFAFCLGMGMALVWVGVFDGVFLQNIFLEPTQQPLSLHLFVDIKFFLMVFLLSGSIYIAATLFPSWRVATKDADEVMR